MAGSSADKASATDLQGNQALGSLQQGQMATTDPRMRGLMAQYASGGANLNDVLSQAKNFQFNDPAADDKRAKLQQVLQSVGDRHDPAAEALRSFATKQLSDMPAQMQNNNAAQQQFADNLATDPLTGTKMATDQVMNNDVLKAPLQNLASDTNADREAVKGNDESYGLTDQDLKAYGQASGQIGRQFASNNQNLSQALADRGLSAGANGAAGQAFSNSYGNQMEQLAGLQTQIAQNRINTAQGLAQFRMNNDMQRASLGQNAIQQQYGRQVAGAENNYNQQQSTAGLNMNNQNLQQNVNNSQYQQMQSSTFHPLSVLGSAAGSLLGGATGGLGAGLGAAAGGAVTGMDAGDFMAARKV